MKKRILTWIASLFLLCSMLVPSSAAETGSGFTDVTADAWYAQPVLWCVNAGLMDGTSAYKFSPEEPAPRVVLVEALYRQAGSPSTGQETHFTDVPLSACYRNAVIWAAEQSIATGYGDGRFGGDDPVTREQFAAFLWRAAGKPDTVEGEPFADQSTISEYAVKAVAWAKAQEIVNGKGNDHFDPQDSITRAEIAAMLYRWLGQGKGNQEEAIDMLKLEIEIGKQIFSATLLDSDTARAFASRLPLTLDMSELNGNEKYFYLNRSLPVNASNPGQIKAGDLMLFGNNCLVLFYESFSTGYSYTRLGQLDDPTGLAAALGRGAAQVTFRAQ